MSKQEQNQSILDGYVTAVGQKMAGHKHDDISGKIITGMTGIAQNQLAMIDGPGTSDEKLAAIRQATEWNINTGIAKFARGVVHHDFS